MPVTAGDEHVGTMGSSARDGRGLAMLRLDRVADALANGDAADRRRHRDPPGEARAGRAFNGRAKRRLPNDDL